MAIKAILFDMDGVLIDAKDWHYEALNRALELFGYAIDRDTHLSAYDGLSTRTKLRMLTKSHGLPVGLHEFLNELKQRYTTQLIYSQCRPNFHHQYALAKLKAEGLKLAVCSNSVRNSVDAMMAQSDLSRYLDLTLSNEDVSKPKPDPEIYSTAIARFGLNPEDVVIVEDNDHGVQSAKASGGHVMRVATVNDVTFWRIKEFVAQLNDVA